MHPAVLPFFKNLSSYVMKYNMYLLKGYWSHNYLSPIMGPINVRPYCYRHFKKQEIERLASDMLSTRLIRCITGAFSSLFFLFEKRTTHDKFCMTIEPSINKQLKIFSYPNTDELLDGLYWSKFFLSWICVPVIIKSVCRRNLSIKRPFETMKGIMSL